MHTPGIKVIVPSTAEDAKGLLLTSIFDPDPCLFVEYSNLVFSQKGDVPAGDYRIPLGVAATRRVGADVSIISYGAQMPVVMKAAGVLADEGIDAEVIDLRTLVPLDVDAILTSVSKTTRAVVVHGAVTFCGPGAELASLITESLWGTLAAPVRRLGAENVPVAFAKELGVHPTVDKVVDAVRTLASGMKYGDWR